MRALTNTVLALTLMLVFLSNVAAQENPAELYFFYSTTCPHCTAEKKFLEEEIGAKYPQLKINYIIAAESWELFSSFCQRYNTSTAGVPKTFVGDKVFIGFDENYHEVVWHQAYRGYVGGPYPIELAIRQELNLTDIISEADAMDAAKKTVLVCNLTSACDEVIASVVLADGKYLVSWWTYDRIRSDLNYPNIIVEIDSGTGHVLSTWVPEEPVYGLKKPRIPEPNYSLLIAAVLLILIPAAYMIFGKHINRRHWLTALAVAVMIFLFVYFTSLSSMNVLEDAKEYSFPIFTAIIALVDGFNPCAFAVLAFLLSILTHTRSRKKMMFIGSVFIMTSGFMYFLFILALLLFMDWVSGQYMDAIRYLVAAVALVAGAINIKDFFYFKQGISLTMSAEEQSSVFKKAGQVVRRVREASSKREMLVAGLATMALAALVNLVELGCTFILPAGYIQALMLNYEGNILAYLGFTLLYSAVYVIPLFAILGIFVYSFKSERLSETQGRLLKLVGGLVMVALGLILVFAPQLLTFGG